MVFVVLRLTRYLISKRNTFIICTFVNTSDEVNNTLNWTRVNFEQQNDNIENNWKLSGNQYSAPHVFRATQ